MSVHVYNPILNMFVIIIMNRSARARAYGAMYACAHSSCCAAFINCYESACFSESKSIETPAQSAVSSLITTTSGYTTSPRSTLSLCNR